MTDNERKKACEKIIDAAKKDADLKASYDAHWFSRFIAYVFVPIGYFIFFFILDSFFKPSTVHAWGLITAFVLDLPLMFGLFITLQEKTPKLSDGRKCFTFKSAVLKALCYVCAFSPFMFLLYGVTYNNHTGTSDLSVGQIILWSPVIFAVLLLYSLFMGSTGSYSNKVNSAGEPVMTRGDWWRMRQEQELAGIDPDKIPIILSPSQIKKMSKLDWYQLGLDLEIAGYDVFKHKK